MASPTIYSSVLYTPSSGRVNLISQMRTLRLPEVQEAAQACSAPVKWVSCSSHQLLPPPMGEDTRNQSVHRIQTRLCSKTRGCPLSLHPSRQAWRCQPRSSPGPGFRPTVVAATEAVDKGSAFSLLESYFNTSLNTVLSMMTSLYVTFMVTSQQLPGSSQEPIQT